MRLNAWLVETIIAAIGLFNSLYFTFVYTHLTGSIIVWSVWIFFLFMCYGDYRFRLTEETILVAENRADPRTQT